MNGKKSTRILIGMLFLAIAITYIPLSHGHKVKAASIADFVNDARWCNGISWGDGQGPKLSSWSSSGCCAYVCDFVKYVYGHNSYKDGVTTFTNVNEIREGDVIYTGNHYFAVLGRSGNQLYTAEGSMDGKVCISNTRYSISGSVISYISKYGPETYRIATGYYHINQPVFYNPEGYVDVVEGITGGIRIAGWALDKDDSAANLDIHVYIGGEAGSSTGECHPIKADKHRPDVGYGNYHGFEDNIYTDKYGQQSVYIYAINIGGGDHICLGSCIVNIIKPDSEPPALMGYDITNLNDKGYTITCTWRDNVGVTKVEFPTWDAETQTGNDATWYQGTSLAVGNTESTWAFTFSNAKAGKKYFTHIYASDAAGNRTCFPLINSTSVDNSIEAKNDTTAPVFENVALTQEEEGTVTLSVQLSDDTGLGKMMSHEYLYYSMDENSSYIIRYASKLISQNINCWQNNSTSIPIIKKNYTVEEVTSVYCDSIVSYILHAWDLSGNYAVESPPRYNDNEIISYYNIRSGDVKGEENRSIEVVLKKGEEITLGTIRQKLSQYNNLDGSDANFDAKNERILKKSNHPDNNMISDIEEEKKVILTANEPGTEYIYFVNLLTGELCSCKIIVGSVSEMRGDVYQDGKIDGKDVSKLARYRLGKEILTDAQIAAGDVYKDGKIDGKDVSKLARYCLGKDTISSQ